MKKRVIKAIIFDLDGTLMNTKKGILKSLDDTVARRGYAPIPEDHKISFVGPPMAKSLKKEYGFSDEECFEAAQEFRDLYAGPNSLLAVSYPHMKSILAKMKWDGYKLGVATYKREDVALNILRHFNLTKYFDIIHGSDFNGKLTKAEIIKMTMLELGSRPANTVVVGDTRGDGLAAKEVGVGFIAVTYGYGIRKGDDISDLAPVAMCENVDQLYTVCSEAHANLGK